MHLDSGRKKNRFSALLKDYKLIIKDMNKEEFKKSIIDAVAEYLNNEEGYGDSAQLEIDPKTFAVEIVDADTDAEDKDYYMLMDMVKGSESNPGSLEPDIETIEEVVAEYFD